MRKGRTTEIKPDRYLILIDLSRDEAAQLARIAKSDERSRTSTARRAVRDFIEARMSMSAQSTGAANGQS